MDATVKTNKIQWLITLVIPLIIMLLPINETFTAEIRFFIAITLLAIFIMAFELVNMMVVSVILPIIYAYTIVDMPTAFSGWMTTTPLMVVGTFILANVMEETGLAKRIAYWCILHCGGTYRGTLYGIIVAGIIIGYATGSTAAALMAAFCYVICKAFDLKPGKEAMLIMMSGILSASTIQMFVYKPLFLGPMIAQAQTVVPGFAFAPLEILKDNFIFVPMLFLIVFCLDKILKPQVSVDGKAFFQKEYNALGSMSVNEKKTSAVMIVLVAFMLVAPFIHLPLDLGFIVLPWLLYFPGINVGSENAVRNINYEMVFFIIACFSIGAVAGKLGFAAIIADTLTTLLAGQSSVVVMFISYIVGFVANFLMTPLAIVTVFTEPLLTIATNMGISIKPVLYAMYLACDQVILPYEYPGYLLFYAFGMASMKEFVKVCSIKFVLCTVFLFILAVPWWILVGIM